MLCKTKSKLLYHATISKCPKVIEFLKTNLKSSLYSRLHYDLEILNEKFRRELHFAVTIHYTIISNIWKKLPKTKVESCEKAQAIMFISYKRALLWFQNDWMKPVGGNAFNTYHILYCYFKNSQKLTKKVRSSKKTQAVFSISYRRALYNFKTIEWTPYEMRLNDWMNTLGVDAFCSYYILHRHFKNSKNSNMVRSSKKHKPGSQWLTAV